MKKEEEKLFNLIKLKLSKKVSFIDEIADVLDLSYDAAYRRIKGKTTLNLAETLKLSNHYNINLNTLLVEAKNDVQKIIVQKTHNVISDNFLHIFFEESVKEIEKLLESKESKLINSLKDYPLYHAGDGYFSKFRIYALINMSSSDVTIKTLPFSEFNPSTEVLKKYHTFLSKYEKVSLVEIWSDSTIDNILNQIQYFFDIGLISKEESLEISDSLVDSLSSIEQQAKNQKRNKSENSYHLYHNNLVSLLNTVLMQTKTNKKVFVPYTNLSYFKVSDENTTNQFEQHLKTQLEFSKNHSGDAAVDRKKFFNTLYQKIENLKTKISASFLQNNFSNSIL
ncbi:helix-turn-helix domain-containing protein [Polaribacter atrinae]|uniref:helix-turn-helix domain-containing protein n=1 Tax=Polaribacter atrinae TaxID=1333662 RepID=UPI0030F5780B